MSQAYPLSPTIGLLMALAWAAMQIMVLAFGIWVLIMLSARINEWLDELLNKPKK